MMIPENPDEEWLGDGDGHDFDDPDFEVEDDVWDTSAHLDVEETWQFAVRREQILECQQSDQTCYLLWHGSRKSPSEAEIIYPTDSIQHVENLLRSWKPTQLEDTEVVTEWPDTYVHRFGRSVNNPPSTIHHFCQSLRARSIECLEDIRAVVKENPDLGHQIEGIAAGLLARYQKAPSMIGKVHTLVIDLLMQGQTLSPLAESFLNTGTTEYDDAFSREFSQEEIDDAIGIGKCRTNAFSFHANTLILPSNITNLNDLQFIIEGEAEGIRDHLYKTYLDSLRFTTSDAVIQNTVITLHNASVGSIREAAKKTLIRLGYGFVPNETLFAWKRRTPASVS